MCTSHWQYSPHLPRWWHPDCSAHFLSYVTAVFSKHIWSCHQSFSCTHNKKSLWSYITETEANTLERFRILQMSCYNLSGFFSSPVTMVTSPSKVQCSLFPLHSFSPHKSICFQVSVSPLMCNFATFSVLLAAFIVILLFLECMVVHSKLFFHNRLCILWAGCSVTNECPTTCSPVLRIHKCLRNME